MKKNLDSYILTREELRIMKIIWKHRDVTVRDVCNAVTRNKPAAYTTIQTLMQILQRKGVLARKKSGRSYLYKPVFSREQAVRNQVADLLQRFFDGSPDRLVKTVLESMLEIGRDENAVLGQDSMIYEVKQAASQGNLQ